MKCPVCNHKHDELNDESFELEYTDTEPFKNIEGHFTISKDCGFKDEVYLYACPNCYNIILGH